MCIDDARHPPVMCFPISFAFFVEGKVLKRFQFKPREILILAGVEIRLTNGGSDFATKSLAGKRSNKRILEPQWQHATEGRKRDLWNPPSGHLWVPTSKTVRNENETTTHFDARIHNTREDRKRPLRQQPKKRIRKKRQTPVGHWLIVADWP